MIIEVTPAACDHNILLNSRFIAQVTPWGDGARIDLYGRDDLYVSDSYPSLVAKLMPLYNVINSLNLS